MATTNQLTYGEINISLIGLEIWITPENVSKLYGVPVNELPDTHPNLNILEFNDVVGYGIEHGFQDEADKFLAWGNNILIQAQKEEPKDKITFGEIMSKAVNKKPK